MRELTFGYSPCPNDTFAFHALTFGHIEASFRVKPVLLDIEEHGAHAERRRHQAVRQRVEGEAVVGAGRVAEGQLTHGPPRAGRRRAPVWPR